MRPPRAGGYPLVGETDTPRGAQRRRLTTIADDGYADGGAPYTDIEGNPTPPPAGDMADESGERVQDGTRRTVTE